MLNLEEQSFQVLRGYLGRRRGGGLSKVCELGLVMKPAVLDQVVESASGAPPELAARSIGAVAGGAELLIPAEGLFDVQTELTRTRTDLADADKQVKRLENLLGGEFTRKAPPDTVERERERLNEQRERLETLERRHETLTRLAGGGGSLE